MPSILLTVTASQICLCINIFHDEFSNLNSDCATGKLNWLNLDFLLFCVFSTMIYAIRKVLVYVNNYKLFVIIHNINCLQKGMTVIIHYRTPLK